MRLLMSFPRGAQNCASPRRGAGGRASARPAHKAWGLFTASSHPTLSLGAASGWRGASFQGVSSLPALPVDSGC